jgi:3'-phosphoadenosine 5'-phosphosulfate sulfotransferase (PAPS reductase)/FAD synthetase
MNGRLSRLGMGLMMIFERNFMQPEILKLKIGTADKLYHFSKSGKPIMYHVGISGGKDSTALLLWMVNESGIPHEQISVTFANTHNEADETYTHVEMLSERVFLIQWLEPEMGFYELARHKKRFPSQLARFCTQFLKMKPAKAFIDALLEQGYEVIAVSGVRADESDERRDLPEWGEPMNSYFGLWEWRPLLRWRVEQVFLLHVRYGIPRNPLYDAGALRVGCFPCINSRKPEIRMMSRKFPRYLDRVRAMEGGVQEANANSTFFQRFKIPLVMRSKEIIAKNGEKMRVATVDDVVRWSNTTRGGKVYLKSYKDQPQQHLIEDLDSDVVLTSDDTGVCSSQFGVCE